MKQHKIAIGVASVAVLGVVLYVVLRETNAGGADGSPTGGSPANGSNAVYVIQTNDKNASSKKPSVKTKALTGLFFSLVFGVYVMVAMARIGVVDLPTVRTTFKGPMSRGMLASLVLAVAVYSQTVGSSTIAALSWFLFAIGAVFALIPFLEKYRSRVEWDVGFAQTETYDATQMVHQSQLSPEGGGLKDQANNHIV